MPHDLIGVAESFVPEILANLDRIDAECQLPPDLARPDGGAQPVLLVRTAGVWAAPELDPLTAFRVVETISRADGSAGWCVFNGSAITAALARLTVDAREGDIRRPAGHAGFRLGPARGHGDHHRGRVHHQRDAGII